MKRFIFLFALLFIISGSFAWWDSNYGKRKEITITTPETETDYQLYINVTYDSDMQSDFDDIRFIDSDDTTELSYWIEEVNDSNWATFYVKIPTFENKTIYMYYGNPTATSKSNGSAVFDFFDDFEDGSIDTNKWDISTKGTWIEEDGVLKQTSTSAEPWGDSNGEMTVGLLGTNVDSRRVHAEVKIASGYYAAVAGKAVASGQDDVLHTHFRVSNNILRCVARIEGSWKTEHDETVSLSNGVWYDLKVYIDGDGNVKTYINGSLVHNFTDTDWDQTWQYIGLGTFQSSAEFDNVWVAKYIPGNISYSFGGEESYGGIDIIIYEPQNISYFQNNITFVFSVEDKTQSSFHVKYYIDSVLEYDNSSYVNSTNITFYHTFSSEGLHNFTVWANGSSTKTESKYFTIKAYELEGQDYSTTVYEATNQNFTITFRYNPDLVDNITAELVWNSTDADASWHFSNSTHIWITAQKTIPLIQTNDTSINFNWDYNVSYTNGTTISESTSTNTQSIYYAFFIEELTSNKDKYLEGEEGTLYAYVKDLSGLADLYVNFTIYVGNATPVKTIDYFTLGDYKVFYTDATIGNATNPSETRDYDAVLYINWIEGNQTAERWHSNESFTLYKIILTNCSAGSISTTKAFTMFLKDEETDASIENGTIEISTDVWYTSSVVRNYAFTYENVSNASVCLYPTWATLNIESMIQYEKEPDYPDRTYFIKGTINNVTDNVYLYLLESGLADSIIIYVKDTSGNPVEGAIVKVQRYYVGTNTYKTVAQVLTDFEGKGATFLRVNEIYYKYIIEQNGSVVRETQPTIIVCTSGSCPPYTVTLTLSEEESSFWSSTLGRIDYTCSFNNLTGVFHCTVSDTSQLVDTFKMTVEKFGLLTEEEVCDVNATTSAATLTCTLTNYTGNTYNYVLKVYSEDVGWVILDSGVLSFGEQEYTWGVLGVVFVFIVSLMAFFMSGGNPSLSIILVIGAITLMYMMGVIPLTSPEIIISLIVVGAVTIWLMGV